MYRMRILLLSSLAVFALSSMISATASAELQGPWWMKLEGGKQVKIEQKSELQIKSDNNLNQVLTPFNIISVGNKHVECQVVLNKGWLWNGEQAHQGLNEESIQFNICTFKEPGCVITRPVTLSQAKVRTELMWKYRGEKKELEEVGTQTIHDVFGPSEPPEKFVGGLRARFLTVTVPAEGGCEARSIGLFATGTKTEWENQQHAKFETIWGTAPQVEPKNIDEKFVTLKWVRPNVKWLHHKGVEVNARLALGEEEAEIQGKIYLEEEFGLTLFGAWDET